MEKTTEVLEQPKMPLVGRIYRHYKGGLYFVAGFVLYSETLEWHVRYCLTDELSKPEEKRLYYARPVSMWHDGRDCQRFELWMPGKGEDS